MYRPDEAARHRYNPRRPSAVRARLRRWLSLATNSDDGTVSRIDPHTNKVVATIRVGRSPYGIAASSRSFWIANLGDGTVSLIEPISGRVVQTVRAGADPLAMAAVGESARVTRNSEDALT